LPLTTTTTVSPVDTVLTTVPTPGTHDMSYHAAPLASTAPLSLTTTTTVPTADTVPTLHIHARSHHDDPPPTRKTTMKHRSVFNGLGPCLSIAHPPLSSTPVPNVHHDLKLKSDSPSHALGVVPSHSTNNDTVPPTTITPPSTRPVRAARTVKFNQ
jgi:hypothetical protein